MEFPIGYGPMAGGGEVELADEGLPYPIALTAWRLAEGIKGDRDVLRCLFLVKDCFEATIRYAAAILMADCLQRGLDTNPRRRQTLLEQMVCPSLGQWVRSVQELSDRLSGAGAPGGLVARLFQDRPGGRRSGASQPTALLQTCLDFSRFRNDILAHGALCPDKVYSDQLNGWLPRLGRLVQGIATLAPAWRLCLPIPQDGCQVWMGPQPTRKVESGDFSPAVEGHFVLRGPPGSNQPLDLYPFLCYLPRSANEQRLYYHDGLSYERSQGEKRGQVRLLEFDTGKREGDARPISAW